MTRWCSSSTTSTDLRQLLELNLRQAGYRTMQAAGGAEALARATALPPELVLLNLNLPDVSGLDICRRLRYRCRPWLAPRC